MGQFPGPLALALLAAGICHTSVARADFSFTTNPATFAALSSAPLTDDFSDLAGSFLASNTLRVTQAPAHTAPYGYRVSADNDIYVIHPDGGAATILSTFAVTPLQFGRFVSNPHDASNTSIRGFSGIVTLLDRQNNPVTGPVTVLARDVRGAERSFNLDLTGSSFVGVFSDQLLHEVLFYTSSGSRYVGLSGAVLAVPEPSGWLLAGVGLGAVALRTRRQHGSTARLF